VVPTEVIMPALGMAQDTGRLVRWLKAEGDVVAKGEPLIEIETDKVTVELEAPADGVLGGVSAAEGDDVPVGQAVAWILAAGEVAPAPAVSPAVGDGETAPAAPTEPPSEPPGDGDGRRYVLASPKARRLAREHGLAIEEITGSGPYGAVVAKDVETPGALQPPPTPRLTPQWRRMAERVQRSWQEVPHFYLQRDVDASRLESWRSAARARPGLETVTHTDLLVKLCAVALAEHPWLNASDDGEINVGVAVATDDALVVPVLHGADRLRLPELVARRAQLVDAARTRKLTPADVTGGTFTISNLGMLGVDAFAAIVNAPQVAILAVGRIAERVVAVDGVPDVRPLLTLTLSCDHRAVDGAAAARFLDRLASLVQEPAQLVD
jgi:pyruvate dehydrogenase E2 component (dihydrolipoamide acetyltransferase)